jgi:hypothetical protein
MLGCTLQNLLARPIWLSRSVHPSHKQITGEKIPLEQAEVCLEEPIFFLTDSLYVPISLARNRNNGKIFIRQMAC